ncbi:putative membrane protein YfcA [Staphylococcus epidermidis]
MDWNLSIMLMIVAFGFIASFVDSVVGGGGLISNPALLAVGLPPSVALGTNKFASSFSTLTSALKFLRSGKVDLKIVGKMFPLIFVASGGAAIIATYIPANILKPLIIIALSLVLIYTVIQKDWGKYKNIYRFYFYKSSIIYINIYCYWIL